MALGRQESSETVGRRRIAGTSAWFGFPAIRSGWAQRIINRKRHRSIAPASTASGSIARRAQSFSIDQIVEKMQRSLEATQSR